MACACGSGTKKNSTWVATLPTGERKTYSSEIEARAAVQRAGGGTIRQQ